MPFPNVRFVYSEAIDAKNGVSFVRKKLKKDKAFLDRFLPASLRFILTKKFTWKERDKIIKEYAADYYKRNHGALTNEFATAQSDWESVRQRYFRLVAKIFKNHQWPKGPYTGFGTIWWCYPRFIQQKTFFFPLNHKTEHYARKVIGHELLHFIFFDYIFQKYGLRENSKITGKESRYVWKVSEAFNSVVQGWEPYQKLFRCLPNPYPETAAIYRVMNRQWRRSQDINRLLDKMFGGF